MPPRAGISLTFDSGFGQDGFMQKQNTELRWSNVTRSAAQLRRGAQGVGPNQPSNRTRRNLHALGEAALAEHAEWALMHRQRPLEHGKT